MGREVTSVIKFLWGKAFLSLVMASLILGIFEYSEVDMPDVSDEDGRDASSYSSGFSTALPVYRVVELSNRPEALGFRLGVWGYDLGGKSHVQGIARSNSADGTPYFFVTTSGSPGKLLVVEMASRDKTGERMRSNRINVFLDTKDTPPPVEDKVVVAHDLEWNHAGGVQVIGNHLVVAVEDGIGLNHGKKGSFIIYNVSAPKNISKVYEHPDLGHKAGVVAITQESDGHYLIMLGPSAYCGCDGTSWDNSNHYMRFFRSNNANDLSGGFTYVNQWHADGDFNRQDNLLDPTYQTLNFVQDDVTGYLYVIGMWNSYVDPGVAGGDDFIDVFRVTKTGSVYEVIKDAVVHRLHMNSKSADNQEQCNFIASGGVYISPGGELIIYSTTHYKATASSIDYIRVAEYRSINIAPFFSPLWRSHAVLNGTQFVVKEGSPVTLDGTASRPQFVKGFIELFENDGYQDKMVTIDWEDYWDFVVTGQSWINLDTVDGFGANADSMKWYVPPGSSILLMHKDWDDNRLGRLLVGGLGLTTISVPDLDAVAWEKLVGDVWYPTTDPMGDDIKYILFFGSGMVNLTEQRWDFGDGSYDNGSLIQDHVYLDDGLYKVNLTVIDSDGDPNQTIATVLVLNAPPDVELGDDITCDEDSEVEFNGTFVDPGALDTHTFEWDFGDGMVSSDTLAPRHTYSEPGSYIVQLTVWDDDGGTGNDTIEVTVRDVTPPVAVSQGDITVGQGTTITLDASGSSDNVRIASYEWTFLYDGLLTTLTGEKAEFDFDIVGVYRVMLRVKDQALLEGTTVFNVTVLDTEEPVANAGEDVAVDNGQAVNFDGSGSTDNEGVVRWTWTFTYGGEAKTIVGDTASFVFTIPGIYTVNLTVQDAKGNTGRDSLLVTVRDTISPTPVITGRLEVMPGEAVELMADSSTDNHYIARYLWTFEDPGPMEIEGVAFSHVYSISGYHVIALEVWDPTGNSASLEATVHVLDTQAPLADAGPDMKIAVGTSVRFDGSGSTDDVKIASYEWSIEKEGFSQKVEGETAQFTFTEVGTYTVTLSVLDTSENVGQDELVIEVMDTGTIKGVILDKRGEPIEGAIVTVTDANGGVRTTTTGPDGSFSLDVRGGAVEWRVSAHGFESVKGSSTVTALSVTELDQSETTMRKVQEDEGYTWGLLLIIVIAAVVMALLAVPRLLRR